MTRVIATIDSGARTPIIPNPSAWAWANFPENFKRRHKGDETQYEGGSSKNLKRAAEYFRKKTAPQDGGEAIGRRPVGKKKSSLFVNQYILSVHWILSAEFAGI